jgi:ubiquinone/menaquinone biosynthesis C-methylase UbiE
VVNEAIVPPAQGEHDEWFEWLAFRRDGASVQQRLHGLGRLAPIRDSVLENASVSEGETVLDIGAGDGLIAFSALDRVGETGRVIFSDVSTDLLEHCARRAGELGVAHRCQFIEAPADDLHLIEDGSVDVVTTRSVLIYVSAKARAFDEFYRVLRPGGRVSIYEPINQLMLDSQRFWSYDVSAVRHIAVKIESLYDSIQDPKTCSMLDFDEQDLLRDAEGSGFDEVHLRLHQDVEPRCEAVPWETFVSSSRNPLVPTLGEAMERALSDAEILEFEAHLRPLVENGIGTLRTAAVFLWATKAPES